MSYKEWSITINETDNGYYLEKELNEKGVQPLEERRQFKNMKDCAYHLYKRLKKESRLIPRQYHND